jgi:DeoR/GlpR family transcriptional regulator of sugar metabolism
MKKTSVKIIEYITKWGQINSQELADRFGIADRAVHNGLIKLL